MKRLELTGERFGTVLVTGPAGNDAYGRSLWHCRCDCGNEYVTTSATLRRTKHCKKCSRLIPLVGRRFGKLTVLRHLYDENMNHLWQCTCDCGNISVHSSAMLLKGHAMSCGKCPINQYEIIDNYVVGKTAAGDEFKFDLEDMALVSGHSWYKTVKGYIVSNTGGFTFLHRLVAKASDDVQVDHINRDKADCRKANLRFVTNQENSYNSATYQSNLSTGHKNVYAVANKYRVIIRHHGKALNFGYYYTLQEAIRVANKKRSDIFGAYAFYDDSLDKTQSNIA